VDCASAERISVKITSILFISISLNDKLRRRRNDGRIKDT